VTNTIYHYWRRRTSEIKFYSQFWLWTKKGNFSIEKNKNSFVDFCALERLEFWANQENLHQGVLKQS